MTTEQTDLFIDHLLDAMRDHCDLRAATMDETDEGSSLWRRTTPKDYLDQLRTEFAENTDAEFRQRIHQALADDKLDEMLFLILSMSRLPAYPLAKKERRPYSIP